MTPDYRQVIRTVIAGLLPAPDGRSAMVGRPLPGPGPALEVMAPAEPLEGLRAGTGLARELQAWIRDVTEQARGDGYTWEEIAEARDIRRAPDATPAAVVAFEEVAADLGLGYPTFPWWCQSCGKRIMDYGPDAGLLADMERGHKDGCERFAAALEAWQRGDGGDE